MKKSITLITALSAVTFIVMLSFAASSDGSDTAVVAQSLADGVDRQAVQVEIGVEPDGSRDPSGFLVTEPGGNQGCLGDTSYGVYGENTSGNYGYLGSVAYGAYGYAATTSSIGVVGEHTTSGNFGVLGNVFYGAWGYHNASNNFGVLGDSSFGVYGEHYTSGNFGHLGSVDYGAYGYAVDSPITFGVYGQHASGNWAYLAGSSFAGYFEGNVNVFGTLSKSAGSFKIDHPLDPENKYLYHSFVESPDMKNIYDGNVVLDNMGEASVELPDWFEVLNRDFRYQLTCIGGFAPVYIAEKISGNQFKIAGGEPGMEVSWQVTGIRHDPYAEEHRIPVEEDKSPEEIGKYQHPELYGQPDTLGVSYLMRVEPLAHDVEPASEE